MGEKVALPSLNLPKQRTHWSVGVVVVGGVLLLILAGAFLAVIRSQQAKTEALARRESDRAEAIKAETERLKAETERDSAETRKKQAEAAASNAAAAAARTKPLIASNGNDVPSKAKASSTNSSTNSSTKKKGLHKGSIASSIASSIATRPALAAPGGPAAPTPAAPAKPTSSKASKDIDDILKGFK